MIMFTDVGRFPRASQVLPRLQGHVAARQREGAWCQRGARPRRHQRGRPAAQTPQLHAGPEHTAATGSYEFMFS